MKFAIYVTDRGGSRYELARVGANPEAVAEGARRKTYRMRHTNRWVRLPCYSRVEVVGLADE